LLLKAHKIPMRNNDRVNLISPLSVFQRFQGNSIASENQLAVKYVSFC